MPVLMIKFNVPGKVLCMVAAACVMTPGTASACAACYGQSDSPLASGMNWGILSLLTTIVFVLGLIAAFFVFLARKSATVEAEAAPARLLSGTNRG